MSFHHRTGPADDLHAYTDASLLLSDNRLGIAIGPYYQGAYWLDSSEPRTNQTDVQWGGARALWQPFRANQQPLLNGLVLHATAMHTIGPANWIPSDEADTRHFVLTGSAVWHFRY